MASLAAAGVAVWLTLRPAAGEPGEHTARVELAPMVLPTLEPGPAPAGPS